MSTMEAPDLTIEVPAESSVKEESAAKAIILGFLNQRNKPLAKLMERFMRAIGKSSYHGALHASPLDHAKYLISAANGEQPKARPLSRPLLSGLAYCISSCSMILLNKFLLSGYGFNAGISLMMYQNLVCVFAVLAMRSFGLVYPERVTWRLVRLWIPVNIIFVGMLATSMFSLKYMNVAMVTILKNTTNILTAVGEFYLFKKKQNGMVWTALFLMIVSAVCGGITDLSFNREGYAWQMVNCVLTASYALFLRRVMDTAKKVTKSGSLSEISMVLLNNALSLPFAAVLILISGEWEYVWHAEATRMASFWVAATFSGLLGLSISFTSMWFLKETGPTLYSMVGSLNKIPLSIAGLALFKVPVSLPNVSSILFGLFAGVFLATAKRRS